MRNQAKSDMNILRIAVALIAAFTLSAADQNWMHLQTENFEIYTTAGEKRGREAILYFEQVRALFGKLFKGANASKLPVRIVAFRNEKEFLPFRPNEFAYAYYHSGLERDYIVMQSVASEHYPVAVHEYMHRVVHSMGLQLPVWFNEGLADLFGSLRPAGNKVELGHMSAGRANVLRSNKMIPLATFLAVDHKSPLYNEKDKAGIFYAQAFVLTHMLYFGEGYKGKLGNLEVALQKTKDPAEAFLSTYGKPLVAVQNDLQNYMRQDRFYYGLVDVKLDKEEEEPETLPVDEYESKIMIADLYRVARNYPESTRMYEEAAKIAPKRPEAEEGLAWLAMNQGKREEALPHFERAIELGSKRPLVFERAAKLDWKDTKRALGYMQRAVELDPEMKDGNLTIGQLAMNARQPQVAIDALNKVKHVSPEQASLLFRAKAHAWMALNNMDNARKNAELAKQYAKTDADRGGVAELDAYFEKRDHSAAPVDVPPSVRRAMPREKRKVVSGDLLDVGCQGKQARITIEEMTGMKSVYLISDPDRIEMRNAEGVTHEFTCGPQQNTRVKVSYVDPAEPVQGVAGVVRAIEFMK